MNNKIAYLSSRARFAGLSAVSLADPRIQARREDATEESSVIFTSISRIVV